jgi:hypothetical protein
MDMYAAKLRIYRPYRVLINDQGVEKAAEDAILQYNKLIFEKGLSHASNAYMLNIFGVLCAVSTKSWEYSESNRCNRLLESSTDSDAKQTLITLLRLAHRVV